MANIQLFTIGFTKKNANTFFTLLKHNNVKRVIDVRLNNVSQLAGFAKRDDLIYFLKELCDIKYVHMPKFAPTKQILDEYKKGKGDWGEYVEKFGQLIRDRQIEKTVALEDLDGACLLCSEHIPDQCHRRLIAEYLKSNYKEINIVHL